MRYYDVALFIFIINVVAGVIVSLNLFAIQPVQPEQPFIDLFDPQSDDRINSTLEQPPVNPQSAIDINFGNFVIGIQIFLAALTYSTLNVFGLTHQLIPVPEIANMMAIIVYFIYLIGIIQLIFNRSFKVQQ
jgi:hypothetical protein